MLKNVYSRGMFGQKRAKFGLHSFWTHPSGIQQWPKIVAFPDLTLIFLYWRILGQLNDFEMKLTFKTLKRIEHFISIFDFIPYQKCYNLVSNRRYIVF